MNGVRRPYVTQSLSFKKATNSRPTGTIKFINEGNSFVKGGSRVDIYDKNNVHVFGGYARKPKVKSYRDFIVTDVELVDNKDILDRRIIAESYVGKMDYEIIQDIYERYLKEEGITLEVVASNSGDIVVETRTETTQSELSTGTLSGVEVSTNGTMTLERVDDNPPIQTIYEDFSTNTNVFGISYEGDGSWSRSSSSYLTGGYSLRSSSIEHREYAGARFNVSVREGAIGKLKIVYRVWP